MRESTTSKRRMVEGWVPGVYDALRQIGPIVLIAIWFCGQLVLYFWYRAKERLYLRHFPPIDGVPLDMLLPGMNPWNGKGAIREVLRQRQADPALERLRHDVWPCGAEASA